MIDYKKTELMPTDCHKSFNGRAVVYEFKNGTKALRSYNTFVYVLSKGGKAYKTWDGWSATTGRHIASFVGKNKKDYAALEYCSIEKALEKCKVEKEAINGLVDREYCFDFSKVSQNPFFGFNAHY